MGASMEGTMIGLTDEVKHCARDSGAHLVGIAPVERFEGAPKGHHPTDLLSGAKSVVSVAVRFYQSVLNAHTFGLKSDAMRVGVLMPLPFEPDKVSRQESQLGYVQEYMYMYHYTIINMGLNWIAARLAYLLTEKGYDALPLPASDWPEEGHEPGRTHPVGVPTLPGIDVPPGRAFALFSHRVAAVLAGLGGLGANNLVITPEYGPRVRLNTVITTAELTPDPMLDEPVCLGEECLACLGSKPCWGELYDFSCGGKSFRVARFMGCKPGMGPEDTQQSNICRRGGWGDLPYMRNCVGACPIGKANS